MLVLSRRVGEVICIGEDVSITVIQTGEGRCRLGISAPSHVRIDRLEVRMENEKHRKEKDDEN